MISNHSLKKNVEMIVSFTSQNQFLELKVWSTYQVTPPSKGLKNEMYAWIYNFSWVLSNKMLNKKVKIVTGNGRKSINISHWNLGARQWPRKILEIRHFLTERTPDIFIITEANLLADTAIEDRKLDGYTEFFTKSMISKGRSRVVVLVRDELNVRIREDLMDDESETIWLQVESGGRKKFLLGAFYREQSLLGQGPNSNSSYKGPQTLRWRKYLKQWKKAANLGDTLVMGDLNLDYSCWDNPSSRNEIMVEETKLEVETLGFHQMTTGQYQNLEGTEGHLTGSHLVQQTRNGTCHNEQT